MAKNFMSKLEKPDSLAVVLLSILLLFDGINVVWGDFATSGNNGCQVLTDPCKITNIRWINVFKGVLEIAGGAFGLYSTFM